ncbi:MAG: putative DNA-binding domain-containing protein [Comamonadaceae bacterium]|nr:putative DNA-binding domain-containing protein [Comamonadaceae bacterium]
MNAFTQPFLLQEPEPPAGRASPTRKAQTSSAANAAASAVLKLASHDSIDASTAAFYDYVRGRTDEVPPGYTEAGLRVYRYLVYLGASQMVEAHHPQLRELLGEAQWRPLIEAFVRDSQWQSNFYEDLNDAFTDFLARASQ